jgi:hypothetical protein
MCSPFTVDNFPRASWDHDKQAYLVYANPETKLHGPSPIMLFPPFKTGSHLFDSEYNLNDKSESKFLFLFPLSSFLYLPYIIYS